MKEQCVSFEKCAQALERVIKNVGNKKGWPVTRKEGKGLKNVYRYSHGFVNEVEKTLNELLKEHSLEETALLMKSPKTIWKMTLDIIVGMRQQPEEWNRIRREELTEKMLRMIPYLKEDDYYYENRTNKLIGMKEDVLKAIEGKYLPKTKKIPYLKSLLWSLSESLYYFCHNIGMEVSGPYDIDGKKYLVHDYHNLKPTDLRTDVKKMSSFRIEKVRIITEYDNETEVVFDAFNNYYLKKGNLADYEKAWVMVNNEIISSDEQIDNLIKEVMEEYVESVDVTNKASFEQRIKNIIRIVFYQLKPWKDSLGWSWEPPSNMSPKEKIKYKAKFADYLDISKEITRREKL